MTNLLATYAISLMLTNTALLTKMVGMPLAEPITTNSIEDFELTATLLGIEGYFRVQKRLFVSLDGSRVAVFRDEANTADYRKPEEADRLTKKWLRETNTHGDAEVIAIARSFLAMLNLNDRDPAMGL